MATADDLLVGVLKPVSRSFYLSVAILPRDLREPIGLGYLLARAADTVADTRLVARSDRIAHLETLRRAYAGDDVDLDPIAGACAHLQPDAAERRLLERVSEALVHVRRLPVEDRRLLERVLATITSGMLFDLAHFPGEDPATLRALQTMDELDHYTYLVAGCVGEFWTLLHIAHRPRLAGWDPGIAAARGIRFGKALQMTNVLRDIPADLRSGRCYLPERELAALGLSPADLLEPAAAPRVTPLLRRLLALALEHYEIAWRYTLDIPRREFRMRLACAWPLHIGLGTLAALAAHRDPLAPKGPVKLTRGAVRGILARSAFTVWSNRALSHDAARLRQRILV